MALKHIACGVCVAAIAAWWIPLAAQPAVEGCAAPALPFGPADIADTITVSASGIIADAQVDVDVTHPFVGEIQIDIASPGGTTVSLHDGQGGFADDILLTYSDAGLPHGSVPFDSGCAVQPSGPGMLADFAGEDREGQWTLSIEDTFPALHDGTLNAWCVRLFELPAPLPDACGPAANDDCASATAISEGEFPVNNLFAGTDGPPGCASLAADVWFLYTPSETATALVGLCGQASFDAAVAVFAAAPGCPPAPGSEIACDNDGCGNPGGPPRVAFMAVAGEEYLIQVGGFNGAEGTGTLSVELLTDCHHPVNGGYRLLFTDLPNTSAPFEGISWVYPPVVDTITIPDSLVISDLNVSLDISHTWLGDLDIELTHETSASSVILHGQGDASDLAGVYIFDDEAPMSLAAAAIGLGGDEVIPPGAYQPTGFLGDLDGLDAQGDWTLTIDDGAPYNDGILRVWSLILNDTPNRVAIPDNDAAGVVTAIDIDPWSPDTIGDLDVDLQIAHPWVGDLVAELTSPGGVTVTLHNQTGGGGSGIQARYDDDWLLGGFNDGLPGTTPPDGPGILGDLDLAPIGGTWTLQVTDSTPGNVGFLEGWQLVVCPVQCEPVQELSCTSDCLAGDVILTWENSHYYEAIEIVRDGSAIATVPGDDTSFIDVGVSSGDHTYEVVADCAPGFEPASCSLEHVLYSGETDIVVALEYYPSGIDSAGAISEALLDNGQQVVTVHALEYPCVDAAQVETLWVMLGTLPASHSLSQAEGELLRDLNVGGMSIYIEGSNTWNIDLPTPFSMYDGVDDNPTGFSTCLELTGVDSGFGLDLSGSGWDADYSNDYPSLEASDHLAPATTDLGGPDAGPIWLCDDGTLTHNSGIFYDSFFGNVIAQSWEFGGYGGDQTALAAVYADALKGISAPAPFLRGDCNSDGNVDIADAIHFLGFLFPPSIIGANGISCRDGCDTNDSGSLDVADAVFLLSHLFAGSGPPPTPYPLCGTDPTSDGLGCAVYNACP